MASSTALVRDLLDLPSNAQQGDFVVKLTDSLAKAEATVGDYVVTPSIRGSFDKALGFIGRCLTDGASRAAYLHGSFGSGKSHFMAMLGLLLEGNPHAWGHRDLQELKPSHEELTGKKLLRIPIHMLGQESLRDAVFGTYIDVIGDAAPDAPLPPLFVDEGLFADAQNLRERIGDDAFFAGLNEGLSDKDEDDGWGELSSGATWDAARFEDACASEDAEARAALVDRLCATYYKHSIETRSRYVSFDEGLAALTAHAKDAGFDGVLLLLDELILWLAGRISDRVLITRELEHTVKLVEAQNLERAVPIISFIARQRSLTDLVGSNSLGADTANLEDQLSYQQGRFTTIQLEERNLPEIVGKRLLRPKDDSAKAQIDRAFGGIVDEVHRDWQTLLGAYGDQDAFRKLYPFSPALVDALVAISDCLQRERTALKMLAEMLTDHLGDLPLGRVVPVGDLFDVVAAGDPIDEPGLRQKFERAKEIYQQKVLPTLYRAHGTGTAEKCQRLRDDHRVSLGCATCDQVACRNSNRLLKTLLLADMVPNLEAFKGLTVSRLVGLNHGAIHSPIPGQEATIAARQLREWASDIPELRIGDEADPSTRMSLDAIDIEPILQRAGQADSDGSRRRILKGMLFKLLGIEDTHDDDVLREVTWKGTKRRCRILFGNVREMSARHLLASDADDVRVVVDYPFDDAGHQPEEDVAMVEAFTDQHPQGSHTVVWLPSFFSSEVQQKLGQLTRLEHIQRNPAQYLSQLRAEDQERAKHAIDNMRSQTHSKLRLALERAYGLIGVDESDRDLDPARTLKRHFYCLMPDRSIPGLVHTDFEKALGDLVDKVLHFRFPKHPNLGSSAVTDKRMEKLLTAFAELRQQPNQTLVTQNHPSKKDLHEVAVPLQLVEATRSGVKLNAARFEAIDKSRRQENLDTPTVGQMRKLLDPDLQVGLPTAVQDLVILCWAEHYDRELRSLGAAILPNIGNLENSQELHAQDLPSAQQWQQALDLAKALVGYASPQQLLSASNLRQFVEELRTRVRSHASDLEAARQALYERLVQLGAEPGGARLQAADDAIEATRIVLEGDPAQVVRELTGLQLSASPTAIGRAIGGAAAQRTALTDDMRFQLIAKKGAEDASFRQEALDALTADEVAVALQSTIQQLANRAMEPGPSPAPVPTPPPTQPGWRLALQETKTDKAAARRLLDELREQIEQAGQIELHVELRTKENGPA